MATIFVRPSNSTDDSNTVPNGWDAWSWGRLPSRSWYCWADCYLNRCTRFDWNASQSRMHWPECNLSSGGSGTGVSSCSGSRTRNCLLIWCDRLVVLNRLKFKSMRARLYPATLPKPTEEIIFSLFLFIHILLALTKELKASNNSFTYLSSPDLRLAHNHKVSDSLCIFTKSFGRYFAETQGRLWLWSFWMLYSMWNYLREHWWPYCSSLTHWTSCQIRFQCFGSASGIGISCQRSRRLRKQ